MFPVTACGNGKFPAWKGKNMRKHQREAINKVKPGPVATPRGSGKSNFVPVVAGSVERAYHRNGQIEGFCVITFDCMLQGSLYPMVAVVFREPGKVAVFDRQKLGDGVIEFGLNSWKGSDFEKDLRAVIGEW